MDSHCALCGDYLADTGRTICPKCEQPKMTAEHAIEMLKNPTKYMFFQNGQIELEGWLKEALKMGIEAIQRGIEIDG